MSNKIPASHFVKQCVANVNNDRLSDEDFRSMVRNNLSITEGGVEEWKAVIEYGVCGYHYEDFTFSGNSIEDLVQAINDRTGVVIEMLVEADEKDGDLRQFCPSFANGYPSLGGMGVVLGGGNLSASMLVLKINGNDVPYAAENYSKIQSLTGIS